MSALIPLMVRGIPWRGAYHGEVYTMARGIPWRGVHHGEGNTMARCIPWRGVYHDEVYAMARDIPWRGVYHYIIQFISNLWQNGWFLQVLRSWRGVHHYMIRFISDLWQVGGFLQVLRSWRGVHHYMIKLVSDLWFSPGTPVSSTNKTDCHDIAKILLKVSLSTLKSTWYWIACTKPCNWVVMYVCSEYRSCLFLLLCCWILELYQECDHVFVCCLFLLLCYWILELYRECVGFWSCTESVLDSGAVPIVWSFFFHFIFY